MTLLLHWNTFQFAQHGVNISKASEHDVQKADWRIIEVYMDDMLVKSKAAEDHIKHLDEMFQILRKYRMNLNPQKCVFGVYSS